ncbi:MAG: peroxidase family protein [Saprospiraceae bacterium]
MLRNLLSIAVFTALSLVSYGQNYRTIDGTQNNLSNPEWGSVGEQLRRITSVSYADGISAPGGSGLTNPRIISNEIFAQDSSLLDHLKLSDFVWVFGQFTDHDVILSTNDPTESASIPVDFEDEFFNPGGIFPDAQIHMSRTLASPGTGTDVNNPREHDNFITSWIDGSNVYGSDMDRANWLRTFVDGKLKVSTGNLLPYNTIDGEFDSAVDTDAPHMENENPFATRLFVAGDVRANENSLLISVHTIFVREHNRYCDVLKAMNPTWGDEQLYQESRRRVYAHIQAITYEEWLPSMGVILEDYDGYDESINATISNVFGTAAFRLGHTLLNANLAMMDNDGNDLGTLALRDAFFTPSTVADNGVDPFFIGMAQQVQQEMDAKVVNDVRNFLFGPPTSGFGGLDLASININRGRERGIAPFNVIRQDLGMTPYSSMSEFATDPEVFDKLNDIYGGINQIDAWVGMLLEEHMPGALFGETILHIMEEQFAELRDGDRFYYENEANNFFTGEVQTIKETTFRDIIMRNSGVTIMQDNVFEAMPHDSICMADGPISEINGAIQTWNGLNIENVEIDATNIEDNSNVTTSTGSNGGFLLEEAESCEHYLVTPSKNTNHLNGVTTNDLIKIIRHIVQIEYLDSPYKIIAADANNSGSVTTSDVVDLRKLLLFIDTELANNDSWTFVDADYVFNDPTDPFSDNFPTTKDVESAGDLLENLNFVAIKTGDVNGTANPDLFNDNDDADSRTKGTLVFKANDQTVKAGEIIQLPIRSSQIDEMSGFQFTLQLNKEALAFDAVLQKSLPALSTGNFNYLEKDGQLLVSWNGDAAELADEDILFTLQFEAHKDGLLSDFVQINSDKISAEAYPSYDVDDLMNVDLRFGAKQEEVILTSFELMQNQPNPFRDNTIIGFQLPEASEVTFSISDITGRMIYNTTLDFEKGYQQFEVDPSMVTGSGSVLYYKVETAFGTATRKMTMVK